MRATSSWMASAPNIPDKIRRRIGVLPENLGFPRQMTGIEYLTYLRSALWANGLLKPEHMAWRCSKKWAWSKERNP